MQECKLVKVPIPVGAKLSVDQCPKTHDILSPGRHISGTTYFWDHMILGGFRHMVFCRWFSISG
jgi:hypothetical protein